MICLFYSSGHTKETEGLARVLTEPCGRGLDASPVSGPDTVARLGPPGGWPALRREAGHLSRAGPAVGMPQAAAWDTVSCLRSASPSPSPSFRQGVRTESLRRARNNKQMAAECFLRGGRPLNDSSVARKAGVNDDGENSVAMTQGLRGQPGAHGIPAPATSRRRRRSTAPPSDPRPPRPTTSPKRTGVISDSSAQNYRDRWLSSLS